MNKAIVIYMLFKIQNNFLKYIKHPNQSSGVYEQQEKNTELQAKRKLSSKASTLIRTTIYSTAIQLKEDTINQIH